MSLLLDALKRAEQAKAGSDPPGTSLELEPKSAPPASGRSANIDASQGVSATRAGQQSAQALFAAKQHAVPENRAAWLAGGGLALLVVAAGGFWLWYTLSFPASPTPLPPRPTIQTQGARPLPGAHGPLTGRPAGGAASAPAPAPPAEPAPMPKDAGVFHKEIPAASRSRRSAQERPARAPALQVHQAATPEPILDPQLAAAYDALRAGDYGRARQQYRGVLASDPMNVDAELGLATISAATGDSAEAYARYHRALELDPQNAVAAAGIATLQANNNAPLSESQLKAQVAANPANDAPQAALGQFYAAQGRWNEAQQAFFEAFRLQPKSPDHAYNLAVSLDHLEQPGLARNYYERALALAATQPSSFDRDQVTGRIAKLAP